MTTTKPIKSLWTSASTLCIGDYLKVRGEWSEITQIVSPKDGTEDFIIKTSTSLLEAKVNSMVEIAA